MPGIRAVIFDFGGVLVRMGDARPRLELAGQLGVSLSSLDELVFSSETAQQAAMGEISALLHWEAVGKALGILPADMPAFLEQYWSADDVNWALLEVIRSLRPRYKVGLLSNAWDDLRNALQNRWKIDTLFDEIIISAEVKLMKPDPHIYHLVVNKLGVLPEEAVFIDDIPANVEAAHGVGLHSIKFIDTQQALSELSPLLDLDFSGT